MATPETASRAAERCILLVFPEEADEQLLKRAAFVARKLGAELEIHCPVVAPPAPHSWMTPQTPPAIEQLGPTRERGRRLACRIEAELNERAIGAHVEAGICRTMTEGILEAVGRHDPGLVIYADTGDRGLGDGPHAVQHDAVWSKLRLPAWVVSATASGADAVLGIVGSRSRPVSTPVEDERVASAVVRLAARFGSDPYLLACEKRLPALAMVGQVMSPSQAGSGLPVRDEIARHVGALARDCGIPDGHARLHRGSEREALEHLLGPLNIGLVVTGGWTRRLFGALVTKHKALDLTGLPCDLLVLGDSDLPYV